MYSSTNNHKSSPGPRKPARSERYLTFCFFVFRTSNYTLSQNITDRLYITTTRDLRSNENEFFSSRIRNENQSPKLNKSLINNIPINNIINLLLIMLIIIYTHTNFRFELKMSMVFF